MNGQEGYRNTNYTGGTCTKTSNKVFKDNCPDKRMPDGSGRGRIFALPPMLIMMLILKMLKMIIGVAMVMVVFMK